MDSSTVQAKIWRNQQPGLSASRSRGGIAVKGGNAMTPGSLLATATHRRPPLGGHLCRFSAQPLNCHCSPDHLPMRIGGADNNRLGWATPDGWFGAELVASRRDRSGRKMSWSAGTRRKASHLGCYQKRLRSIGWRRGTKAGGNDEECHLESKRRVRHGCRTSCIVQVAGMGGNISF